MSTTNVDGLLEEDLVLKEDTSILKLKVAWKSQKINNTTRKNSGKLTENKVEVENGLYLSW